MGIETLKSIRERYYAQAEINEFRAEATRNLADKTFWLANAQWWRAQADAIIIPTERPNNETR